MMYIADDGESFENEDECRAYERNLEERNMEKYVKLFNEKGEPIPFTLTDKAFKDAFFIEITSDDVAEKIDDVIPINLLPWDDTGGVAGAGKWVYNHYHNKWIRLVDLEDLYKMGLRLLS